MSGFRPAFPVRPRGYGHSPDGMRWENGRPVYRVKAWRVPNEDRPAWAIVVRRAPPYSFRWEVPRELRFPTRSLKLDEEGS